MTQKFDANSTNVTEESYMKNFRIYSTFSTSILILLNSSLKGPVIIIVHACFNH